MTGPSITIILHGDEDSDLPERVRALLEENLTRDDRRSVSLAWDRFPPRDELFASAKALWELIEATRSGPVSNAWRMLPEELQQQIGEALLNLQIALAGAHAPFVPSPQQVLWAMNVVGVMMTSAGHTLEELIPAAEYADFVRQIIDAAQSKTADKLYPATGSMIDAARQHGHLTAHYGELIREGKPLSDALPGQIDIAVSCMPDGMTLLGFGPTAWRGLQVDYENPITHERSSTFQMGLMPKHIALAVEQMGKKTDGEG